MTPLPWQRAARAKVPWSTAAKQSSPSAAALPCSGCAVVCSAKGRMWGDGLPAAYKLPTRPHTPASMRPTPGPMPCSEMFNCNYFLVSQANPYVLPLVGAPCHPWVGMVGTL